MFDSNKISQFSCKTAQGRSAWIIVRPTSILRLLTTSPFPVCMTGALTSAASGQSNLHTHLQTHSHFSFLTSSLNQIARRRVGAHRPHRISFKYKRQLNSKAEIQHGVPSRSSERPGQQRVGAGYPGQGNPGKPGDAPESGPSSPRSKADLFQHQQR